MIWVEVFYIMRRKNHANASRGSRIFARRCLCSFLGFGSFDRGAKIFAKEVHDPKRFGVVEFDKELKVLSVEEKPEKPKSNYAAVGMYIYDNRVVDIAKNLKPSERGEIEITDLNKVYLKKGELAVGLIDGIWEDAGTFDSLLRVSSVMAAKAAMKND